MVLCPVVWAWLSAHHGTQSDRMRDATSARPLLSVPDAIVTNVGKTGIGSKRGPFVVSPTSGVRIRTRLHVTAAEGLTLRGIGSFLGGCYRTELADRIGLGRLDRKAQAAWRANVKRALTTVTSSRWAGAITRAVEDQYQLDWTPYCTEEHYGPTSD